MLLGRGVLISGALSRVPHAFGVAGEGALFSQTAVDARDSVKNKLTKRGARDRKAGVKAVETPIHFRIRYYGKHSAAFDYPTRDAAVVMARECNRNRRVGARYDALHCGPHDCWHVYNRVTGWLGRSR